MIVEDEISEQKTSRMSIYNFMTEISPNEWTRMGEDYFGDNNINYSGTVESFRKLNGFDALSLEKKQMIYRFKSAVENDKITEKNTRVCFVNEEIKVQFYIYNPLFKDIELTNCSVVLSTIGQNSNNTFVLQPKAQNVKIKGSSEKMIEFSVVPQEAGLFELTKLVWYFNRLYNEYELPKYQNGTERNYYFKLNVQKQVGKLRAVFVLEESVTYIGTLQ